MRAELNLAINEGNGFRFACSRLFAAMRELSTHPEGRFALTKHAVALGLISFSASLFCTVVAGHPFSADRRLVLNDGQVAFAPSLALLAVTLAATQLVPAWFVTERIWSRATAAMLLGAATVGALAPLASLLPLASTALIALSTVLSAEAVILPLLVRWHERLRLTAFRSSE